MRSALVSLALLLLLSACSSDFDPTDFTEKLDFFHVNEKKKLPGERKELFPGGVPGVTQGIPPELVKGYQPPATEALEASQEQQPQPQAEPEKPKPKPHVAHRTPPKQKKQPTQVKVTPSQPKQTEQAEQQQIWPDPQPQGQQQTGAQTPPTRQQQTSPWPAPQQQTSPWPDAPPPNTFQH